MFLRVLEDYQGIMVLTTNQIAMFDVAVQSRIHIAIEYSDLDKEQTQSIFMQFLNQYSKNGLVKDTEKESIRRFLEKDLHKKKFDGRQLRNIVTSAMGLALAREENRKMTLQDVMTIVNNMHSFKENLGYQMKRYGGELLVFSFHDLRADIFAELQSGGAHRGY